MLSKGSGVHSLCPPNYRKMKKLQKYVQLQFATDIRTQRWGAVYTVHTMGKKTAPENQIHCFDGKESCS
jgi:hypothetical protein